MGGEEAATQRFGLRAVAPRDESVHTQHEGLVGEDGGGEGAIKDVELSQRGRRVVPGQRRAYRIEHRELG